jgi:DNA-directed RNA polymerase subunit RPC12/RpoP
MTPSEGQLLQFTCPQCMASLTTPWSMAGTRHRCPYCQSVFDAPRQMPTPPKIDVYQVQQQAGPSPPAQPAYVPVICSVCHTRMYATPEQVGQTLVCPDCGTPAVVPRFSPPVGPAAKPAAPPIVTDVYQVHGESPTASDSAADDEKSLIRVVCPRCNTMMYGTKDQIGTSLFCPDCGASIVVPAPAPPRALIDVTTDCYALAGGDAAAAKEPVRSPPPRVAEKPPVARRPERQFTPYFRHPLLPRQPFLTGTFAFPFGAEARAHTLVLACWAIATAWLAQQSIQLSKEYDPRSQFVGAMLNGLSMIVALLFAGFAAASGSAVVRDTAGGSSQATSLPNVDFMSWFGDLVYIFNALCASLAPGAGLAWLLAQNGHSAEAVAPVVLFLLFPVVLLSMFEVDSPWGLISWPVCRTLWQAWRGWAAFYATSAALVTAATLVSTAIVSAKGLDGMVIVAPILTVAGLIYFRLLGRLAWYCTDRTRRLAEAAEEERPEVETPVPSESGLT